MNQLEILQAELPNLELHADATSRQIYGQDWTRFRQPDPLAVVFPRSIEELQSLVLLARKLKLALVPSGGRTGLSGGAVASEGELVVSFEKMRKISGFNALEKTVNVEAGVITAQLQAFALEQELFYPVSFAAEGSSEIGGNIATNAGGIRVLRYGMTRNWVEGLTVVTGAGDVLELNRGLIKNASGYDLRHLFIGSEGTLGFIVAATMRLCRQAAGQTVMLLACASMDAVMQLFLTCQNQLELSAFEFFSDQALDKVCQHRQLTAPLETPAPFYVLCEFDSDEDTSMAVFEQGFEAGWLLDGVISQSGAQMEELWQYREGISESITAYTPYKNDLSVRVSLVPGFMQELDQLVAASYPDFEVIWFGHIGDGNLHMNVLKPESMEIDDFEQACKLVSIEVYQLVEKYQGSVSAEHGIGLLKQAALKYARSEVEIQLMRGMKKIFDPDNIMNPGKLFAND